MADRRPDRTLRSALVAAGAPNGPALSVNLPQVSRWGAPHVELAHKVTSGSMPFSLGGGWNTDADPGTVRELLIDDVGAKVTAEHRSNWGSCTAYDHGDWFAVFDTESLYWSVEVAANSMAVAERIVAALEALAGRPKRDDDAVNMAVWSFNPMTAGGSARYASMKVGTWTDVLSNYPPAVADQLAALAESLPDVTAGGLAVFCGGAGTGKTRAVEALAHAWAPDATLGVVVDSDMLLTHAGYIADVLANAGGERQVVVVEDCDLMLTKQRAKTNETAKLLNVADGILGRLSGGGTLFVLTANLPRSDLASYITRPGRAAAVVEFTSFTTDEAAVWLAARGVTVDLDHDRYTLAELYALTR